MSHPRPCRAHLGSGAASVPYLKKADNTSQQEEQHAASLPMVTEEVGEASWRTVCIEREAFTDQEAYIETLDYVRSRSTERGAQNAVGDVTQYHAHTVATLIHTQIRESCRSGNRLPRRRV